MEELDKAGLSTKEAASLSQEQRKLKDVVFEKSKTTRPIFFSRRSRQVYMSEEIDEIERNARLYREIRYTKLSTSSMKRSSDVFRLKKDHITLDSEDYAHNLKAYFCCTHSISINTISLESFSTIKIITTFQTFLQNLKKLC